VLQYNAVLLLLLLFAILQYCLVREALCIGAPTTTASKPRRFNLSMHKALQRSDRRNGSHAPYLLWRTLQRKPSL
jgi:hypothetical protein